MSLLLLLLSSAFAEESVRSTVGAHASLGVPIGARGLATGYGLDFGWEFPSNLAVTGRVLVEPAPPALFGLDTPKIGAGPLVDLRWHVPVSDTTDLAPGFGVGFIAGISEETGRNIVLPIVEGHLSARVHPAGDGAGLYLEPEIGLADFFIPYVGVSVGYLSAHK